jgi:hypothetical protein
MWSYHKSRQSIAGFYMNHEPQLSIGWESARHGKLTAGSLKYFLNYADLDESSRLKLAYDVMYGKIPSRPEDDSISSENIARSAYCQQFVHPAHQTAVIPGLCVPDPFDPFYNFIPENKRFMLLNMCASPDLLICDRNNEWMKMVEIKCPQKGELYPAVLRKNRPLPKHSLQCQWYMGILGCSVGDYYLYHPENTYNVSVENTGLWKSRIMNCIDFISHYIVHEPVITCMNIPEQLEDYYLTSLQKFLTNN